MQLENIASIVNPDGGIFLMQDILGSRSLEKNINHPLGPFLYTISCMHCMSVFLAQNEAGLGAMWGEERAIEMLKNAGFISHSSIPSCAQSGIRSRTTIFFCHKVGI